MSKVNQRSKWMNPALIFSNVENHCMFGGFHFLIVTLLGLFFYNPLWMSQLETTLNSDKSGETLYLEYCSACHGIQGKGDGNLSYLVYPKPRDFSKGTFKIRSTLSGYPPTDNDLFNTIVRGMPGTAMPSFYFLKEEDIHSLVNYIKILGGVENDGVQSISIPSVLPTSPELVELGKEVYLESGCSKCHGNVGRGDGPSSQSLIDSWGYPVIPKDFTSGVYLGGGGIKDLYLRFVCGLDGTPMPSYGNLAESLGRSPSEQNKLVWGLVHYIKSLETVDERKVDLESQQGLIVAKHSEQPKNAEDFLDPFALVWQEAKRYLLPVSRLWQSDRINYQVLEVQTLYNSNYIAIRLSWIDDTPDQQMYRVQDFQDGVALQFSLDGTKGFHGMGSQDHPVEIWYWRAEWQQHQDDQSIADIKQAYTNRVVDSDITTYPTLISDMAYLAGRDAGNLISSPIVSSVVEKAQAVGPQTLTTTEQSSQVINAKGLWDGKHWQVVFVRKLKSKASNTMDFKLGKTVPIGFAVWNGSEGDRDGQKMVSTWYSLQLKE